jgi:hypothetical protein
MIIRNAFPELTDCERSLVDSTYRFGLLVPPLLAAATGEAFEGIRKHADALVGKDVLLRRRAPTDKRSSYFTLSPAACYRLGIKAAPPGGYPLRGLLRRLAVTIFCLRRRVTKLSAEEFQRHFPDLYVPGSNCADYFLDRDGASVIRLGWMLIDNDRDIRRLRTVAGEEVRKRFRITEFRRCILRGEFLLAVLCLTDRKAQLVQEAFVERPLRHVPVLVESIEHELACLPLARTRSYP